ncbi:MAG: GIY-YIG nuclease family protein [Oscillospiraceae bacterium]|nr:GIY-YIG nuclease family protein [Oscillospiraceae bacterium]
MKENLTKKEQLAQYKARTVVGGVYAIRNTINQKRLIEATVDMQGSRNRFTFAQSTSSCVHLKLQDDWRAQGGGAFVFEVLEEMKKGETQTAEEFKADVEALKELWMEKWTSDELY